uniref:Uncharacterized protein n=1 Tax=Caenorhabditis japonica TaxID=281687 RepID=A0A8R1IB67_CAEJA
MSKAINLVTTKAVTVPVHFNRSTPPSVDEWLKQSLEVFDANLEGAEKAYKLWPTTKARHTNHCSESTETALQALRASMILHRYALSTAKESAIKGITTLDQADETATEAVKAWEKACDSNEVNEAVAQLSAIIAKIEQIPSEKDETPQSEGELVQEWLTQTESPIMKGERASDQSGANSTKSSEHCSKVFQDDDLESQVQGNRRCSTTDEEEIRILELSDAMHEQRELEKDLERRQTSLQVNAQKRAELSKKMVEHLNEMKEVDTLLRQTMVSQVADSQALRQIRRETDEKQMKIAEIAAATSDIRQRNQLLNGQTENVYESQHQNAPIISSPEGVQEQHILTLTNALLELTEKVESLKRATEHPKSEWEHTPAPRHDPLYTIRTMDKETTWKSEMGKGEFSEDYERALKNDKRYHSEPAVFPRTPVPPLPIGSSVMHSRELAKQTKIETIPNQRVELIERRKYELEEEGLVIPSRKSPAGLIDEGTSNLAQLPEGYEDEENTERETNTESDDSDPERNESENTPLTAQTNPKRTRAMLSRKAKSRWINYVCAAEVRGTQRVPEDTPDPKVNTPSAYSKSYTTREELVEATRVIMLRRPKLRRSYTLPPDRCIFSEPASFQTPPPRSVVNSPFGMNSQPF